MFYMTFVQIAEFDWLLMRLRVNLTKIFKNLLLWNHKMDEVETRFYN